MAGEENQEAFQAFQEEAWAFLAYQGGKEKAKGASSLDRILEARVAKQGTQAVAEKENPAEALEEEASHPY